jgi:cytidylate kinase
MYRALARTALERGIEPDDDEALTDLLKGLDIQVVGDKVTVDGADISADIRSEAVNEVVPIVAAQPKVREAFVETQRREAASRRVVMEGRDIGSVVLPEAMVKIFLTASPEERATRRVAQEGLPSDPATIARTLSAMQARDDADSTRAESPLTKASDAIEIDTTNKTIDQVVDEIVDEVRARMGSSA